jgi:hypothetical protein
VTVEIEPAIGRPECTRSDIYQVGHRSAWTAEQALIEATGPCLPILFDESGMALADLTAGADVGAPASSWEPVDLEAADLAGLASAWFNELMKQAGDHRAELVDVAVDTVAAPASGTGGGWRLQGRVGLRRLFGRHGPARHDLRATTSLRIKATDKTWTLRARLDPVPEPSSLDDHQRPQASDASQLAGSLGDQDDLGHVLVGKRGFLGEHARPLSTDDDALTCELTGNVDAA